MTAIKKIKPVAYNKDTGQLSPDFTKDDFNRAALIGNSFKEAQTVTAYNKDRADAYKIKAGADALTLKAKTDAIYKGALGSSALKKANAYASKMSAQVKGMKKEEDKDALLDELYKRNLLNQSSLVTGVGGGKVVLSKVMAQKSLPMFTIDGKTVKQLAPINSTELKISRGK